MDSQPIPRIPDHELLCRIGRGSYGEAWLARSVTGEFRAVKIIHRQSFDHQRPYDREFHGIKKFEPVSRASATQVDILHVGQDEAAGFFFYVMELADDQKTGFQINPADYSPRTLRSEVHQHGRLPLAQCLDIGVQLTLALEHLHGNGLVHRDIKPSNIVFVNGVPKLADVGLVTTIDASKSFVGTEGYVPAEGPGTPQADIYGLGKVLYELSTGRDRLDFPELPSDLRDHPESQALVQFNEVILKACEEDRRQRYQSAAAMRADLLTLKAGQPLARQRPAVGWRLVVTGVLLVALLGAAGLWGRLRSRVAPRPISLAIPQTSPLAPAAGLVAWWTADNNALDSAGTNHGRLLEGAGYEAGKIGLAFSFNGTTACITVPNSPLWALGRQDFSLALWANFYAASPTQTLVACEDGIDNHDAWKFCLYDGRLQWQVNGRPVPVALGAARFSPVIGQWYHLALVRHGEQFCFYINGSLVATETWAGEIPRPTGFLTLGNGWGGIGFKGLMDDIRIYHRALTAGEIQALNPSGDSPAPDLVAVGSRQYQRRELLINTSIEDKNSQVNLAVLADGKLLATWHQGLSWHCYGQLFNPDGLPAGAVFLINARQPDETQWGPAPAPLPGGGFVVAWGKNGDSNCVSAAQCFDAAAAPVAAPFALGLPDWTTLAAARSGDFLAAGNYAVGARSGMDLPVYARRFDSAGVPLGQVFQVGDGYATVAAAYGDDGRFAFGWPAHGGKVMVRAYRTNEFTPWSEAIQANSFSQRGGLVSVRYEPRNRLLVAWTGSSPAVTNALFVRQFDPNLVPEKPEWAVNEAAPAHGWCSSLSPGQGDDILLVWNSGASDLYGRLLDRQGTAIGHEFRINQETTGNRTLGWEACPHAAVLANGNLIVGWKGSGAKGNGLYLDILRLISAPAPASANGN